jgi:UDP-glucose 4-epimerase
MSRGAVLVTGASGWVGRSLVAHLSQRGRSVHAASRICSAASIDGAGVVHFPGLELGTDTAWQQALAGVDSVVHCAARVHVLRDLAADPLAEYRRVNVAGTMALARAAALAGIRRFVFVSTAHVNGMETARGRPFTARQVPRPETPYGISKWEAEQGLAELAREGRMELVVLRPPLVVGAGVGGNLSGLIAAVARGIPLPFGNIDNRRSLIGLSDLVDAIEVCIDHPGANGRTLLVGDPQDLSTPDLVRLMADGLGRPARLFGLPWPLVRAASKLLGRQGAVRSLWGNLQLDCRDTYASIGWSPAKGIGASIAAAVSHFVKVGPP